MDIHYAPLFIRKIKSLPPALREETLFAVDDLRDKTNHKRLKVHKLKGRLAGMYAFSVNYKIRIVFEYTKEKDIVLLSVGNHDIYN